MTADKTMSLAEAAGVIGDSACIYVGGAVLRRKPMAMLRALSERSPQDLEVMTFAGSVDVDLLVATGCVSVVSSAYVGLGAAGSAPVFKRAAEAGEIEDREYSEWTMLAGLRAASMGVPFIPTRATANSDLLDHLTPAEVEDPYGTGSYLAIRPIHPDVAIIHGWRATPQGAVQFAWPPEHLWDVDVVAAQAARHVIVTVEEIVGSDTVDADPHLTVLLPVDVDAVVEAPGGSWPTASPPGIDEDHDTIGQYARTGDVGLISDQAA